MNTISSDYWDGLCGMQSAREFFGNAPAIMSGAEALREYAVWAAESEDFPDDTDADAIEGGLAEYLDAVLADGWRAMRCSEIAAL